MARQEGLEVHQGEGVRGDEENLVGDFEGAEADDLSVLFLRRRRRGRGRLWVVGAGAVHPLDGFCVVARWWYGVEVLFYVA